MYVEIPYCRISHDALIGIVEEYISREGTDYGHYDYTFEEKVDAVLNQIKSGEAKIFFHHESKSINILRLDQVPANV